MSYYNFELQISQKSETEKQNNQRQDTNESNMFELSIIHEGQQLQKQISEAIQIKCNPISTQRLFQKGFKHINIKPNVDIDVDINVDEITKLKKDFRKTQSVNQLIQLDGYQNKSMFLISQSLSKDQIFTNPNKIKILFQNNQENSQISSQFNILYFFNQLNQSVDKNTSFPNEDIEINIEEDLKYNKIPSVKQNQFSITLYQPQKGVTFSH